MEEKLLSSDDVDLICSYLRVGADIETALTAFCKIDGSALTKEEREHFKENYKDEIERAIATCRVLCLHNIMTEGGVTSSQYILKRIEQGEEGLATNDIDNESEVSVWQL